MHYSQLVSISVVKPLIVDGSANHMNYLWLINSLLKLEPPLFCKSLLNMVCINYYSELIIFTVTITLLLTWEPSFTWLAVGGVLFKVYIVGEAIKGLYSCLAEI